MVSWKPCLIATAGYEYNCLVVHVTWYYTAYCIYVYTKARENEFRELYRSYWRLAGLTDELWRTALVFTKSTSVKTGGQAPPLPNASYATVVVPIFFLLPTERQRRRSGRYGERRGRNHTWVIYYVPVSGKSSLMEPTSSASRELQSSK